MRYTRYTQTQMTGELLDPREFSGEPLGSCCTNISILIPPPCPAEAP